MTKATVRQEWIELDHQDREGWRWRIDLTTMSSNFHCLYGNGCRGLNGNPVSGCCSEGAYLDAEDDIAVIEYGRQNLPNELWEQHKLGRKKAVVTAPDRTSLKTRVVNDHCVFGNSESHAYPGCALHHLAIAEGRHHADLKPQICWLVPLYTFEIEDAEVIEVRIMRTRDWSADADTENLIYTSEDDEVWDWWCGNDPLAHQPTPDGKKTYQHFATELTKMLGEDNYQTLCAYIEALEPIRQAVPVDLVTKPQPQSVIVED